MILEFNDNDKVVKVKLSFTMKKIVDMTNKNKGKSFKDLFFMNMAETNFEFLANVVLAFFDKNESENIEFNGDLNRVYDFIQKYVESKKDYDYETLYSDIAEAINDKSFFGKKMSKEDLLKETSNPLMGIDINQLVKDSAGSVIKEVAHEEFQGFRG